MASQVTFDIGKSAERQRRKAQRVKHPGLTSTSLEDTEMDRALVQNLPGSGVLEAEYSNARVAVYSNLVMDEAALYAPQAEHLAVNGEPVGFAGF